MCECKCNQTDYFENEEKIEEFRKLVNSDMWKQDTIKIKKILIKLQKLLNDKWDKSEIVLAKLNAEMSKIHDAKKRQVLHYCTGEQIACSKEEMRKNWLLSI